MVSFKGVRRRITYRISMHGGLEELGAAAAEWLTRGNAALRSAAPFRDELYHGSAWVTLNDASGPRTLRVKDGSDEELETVLLAQVTNPLWEMAGLDVRTHVTPDSHPLDPGLWRFSLKANLLHSRHVLQLRFRIASDTLHEISSENGGSDPWRTFLLDFLSRHFIDYADAGYNLNDAETALEESLVHCGDHSSKLEAGRDRLRGYSWFTAAPLHLFSGAGGIAALRASAAFEQVTVLPSDVVVLDAARTADDFTGDRVRAVFESLRCVLPPGPLATTPEYGAKGVYPLVYEDASDFPSNQPAVSKSP